MVEEPEKQCDIDDLLCQFEVMSHLEGMQKLLGSEKFKVRYPEFAGLEKTMAERISEQEITIRGALERCGRPPKEETVEIPKEEGEK